MSSDDRRRWRQVMADLRRWIADQALPPGARLPSEAELAERFSVHRLTVRQALGELARAGVIRTVHGRGSYVADLPYRFRVLPDAPSIIAQIRAQNRVVTQELVGHSIVARADLPDPPTLPDAELLRLDTVMAVDGEIWSRNSTWLPAQRFAGIPSVWTDQTSLTAVLAGAYGLRQRRAWRRYSAEPADPDDADTLDVSLGYPLLVLVGANTDQHGEPLTQLARRARGDRIEYMITLTDDI
ncbi:MAG: GntR family transcriptional regulator [Pseudonocardiaceae bacterium]